MIKTLSSQLAVGATLIVDDRLAAVQLEACLLGAADRASHRVWTSPNIRTHGTWTAASWSGQRTAERLPLSSAQSAALWRRIVASTDDGGGASMHAEQLAAWAREAWRLLLDWQIDFRELRAHDGDVGFASFLSWAARYRDALLERGWIDAAQLNAALCASSEWRDAVPGPLVWVDPVSRTPALERLVDHAAGGRAGAWCWEPPPVKSSARRLAVADRREELGAAMHWAQRKMAQNPNARIALVVASADDNELWVERWAVDATAAAPVFLGGRPADRDPVIGAALDLLGLLGRQAGFTSLSRCLRTPFLGEALEDRSTRSSIEAALRGELLAQLNFLPAYRVGGLRGWLAQRAPALTRAIDGCLARLDGPARYRSATQWAGFAQETLAALGWPGAGAHAWQGLDAWDGIVAELAALTSVLGPIDFERALTEIRALASRTRIPVAVPSAGITVLERPEQLGLGYDAAWVTGMTDRAWPRPARPNPLLSPTLQAARQMPFATPGDALSRCRAITARLIARVPEIVFSYPSIEDDYAAAPSPLLADIEAMDVDVTVPARCGQPAAIETLADPLPALRGSAIPGGAGTLAMQARCPLRAFLEGRLAARALERVEHGIAARHRGLLTHRTLELLLAGCAGREELAGHSPEALAERIRASVDRAFAERVRASGAALRVFLRLERDRVAALAAALVASDLARGNFTIEGLEVRRTVTLAGLETRCRIDRIDRLTDGRLAIIDYKTGQRAAPIDWLKARLLEPQLPLYLQAASGEVGALMFGALQPGGVGYRGISDVAGAFAGRLQRLPPGVDWAAQRERWAEQLTALLLEFASGDGRIFLASHDAATGAFAPLTRVYEQIAAVREAAAAGKS